MSLFDRFRPTKWDEQEEERRAALKTSARIREDVYRTASIAGIILAFCIVAGIVIFPWIVGAVTIWQQLR